MDGNGGGRDNSIGVVGGVLIYISMSSSFSVYLGTSFGRCGVVGRGCNPRRNLDYL